MSAERPPARHQRRTAERSEMRRARAASPTRPSRLRAAVFGLVVVGVLGAGVVLAAADLLGQRGAPTTAEAMPVRMSMAGFDPGVMTVRAGQAVAIDFWTTDAAPHLEGGVHTFISEELGIREELRAESRRTFTFTAPAKPGDYDVYCDTCCGGKDSPTMHGIIRVES